MMKRSWLTVIAFLAGLTWLALLAPGGVAPSVAAGPPMSTPARVSWLDLKGWVPLGRQPSMVGPSHSLLGTSQLLQNAGFESGAWPPWQTFSVPFLDNGVPHIGVWAAHLGNADNANDQILQTVTIPAEATAVTLDFWYRLDTAESVANADFFCGGIFHQSGSPAYVLRCADFGQTGNLDWTQETYNLTPAELTNIAGQTVLVGFLVQTDFFLPSRA